MTDSKPIRVIIDTNIWISFLIGQHLGGLKSLLVENTIRPILCQQLLDEITLVTQKPKLQKYFPPEKVTNLIDFLQLIGVVVKIESTISLCRDPKDDYLLALAKDGAVDYLITGDADLLILKNFESTAILTYQDFVAKLQV